MIMDTHEMDYKGFKMNGFLALFYSSLYGKLLQCGVL